MNHTSSKLLFLCLFFFSLIKINGQSIIVNDPTDPESNFTPEELLSNVLVDGCSTIQFDFLQENPDGVTDLTSRSWGYFRNTNPAFPFDEGIILSSGFGTSAQGPNDQTGVSDTSITGVWGGDADLETILNNFNNDAEITNNATVFEFRFTSIASSISFDFIFASEEYEDDFECDKSFRDGFVFLIKGPGIPDDSGTAFGGTNIALVPGLNNIPVSTGTIHLPGISGGGTDCDGQVDGVDFRSDLYISNTGANNTNVIQFDGFTNVLTAQTNVTPGAEYTMKLVIADRSDSSFDSAVFLRASSLNLGTADLGADIDVCDTSAVITDNGGPYSGSETYEWFFQTLTNQIPGEFNPSITVNQSGTYFVVVTDGTCQYQDSIEVDLQGGVEAGVDGTANYCITDSMFNLLDQLGGTPDTGGVWTGPSTLANGDLGTFDPANNTAGTYTYTVTLVNNGVTCTDTSEVIVTEVSSPSFTVNTVDPSVCGATDGRIEISGLLANTDYNITYTDDGTVVGPAVFTSDTSGVVTITGLNAGTYTDIVLDAGGCVGNDPGPYVLNDPALVFTVTTIDNSNCVSPNGSMTLAGLVPNKAYEITYEEDGVVVGPVSITANASGEVIINNLDDATFTNITVTCVDTPSCTTTDPGPYVVNDLISFLEDFGAGLGRVSTPFTNYIFNGFTQVNDGEYAVNSNASDLNTGWHNMEDHTAGDTDGRMFVVNASFVTGEFYRRTIPVAQNTDYDFSAWITGVYDSDTGICGGTGVPANVTFRIEDISGALIDEVNTGDIQNGPDPNWQEFTLTFNTLGNAQVQLVLLNNGLGGCGNDLAIDDISLTANNQVLLPTITVNDPDCATDGQTGSILFSDLQPNTSYELSYDYNGVAQGPITITTNASGEFLLDNLALGTYDNVVLELINCTSSAPAGPFELIEAVLNTNLLVEEPTTCLVEDGRFIFTNLSPGATYIVNYSLDGVLVGPLNITANTNGEVIIDGLGTGVYSDFSIAITTCSEDILETHEFAACSIIPQGISPNNDNINDSFDVAWLNAERIKIYNRYGTKVYELEDYRDQWFGTTNDGEELPVGTYFYVIELPEGGGEPISGWVYVNREE